MSEANQTKEKKSAGEAKAKKGKAAASLNTAIAAAGETRVSPSKTPRLLTTYRKTIVPGLMKELQLENPMDVPRVVKVTITPTAFPLRTLNAAIAFFARVKTAF